MQLNNLKRGKLVERYKRFLADVELDEGVVTAHCPNSGSMKSLIQPKNTVYITENQDENRKLKYTLHLIETKNGVACVNTNLANEIVYEALRLKTVPGLKYDKVEKEIKYGENSRVDILLTGKKKTFVEVKNVTLEEEGMKGVAQFPDSVTKRGQKHLRELANEVKNGNDAVIFFLVNRTDSCGFKIAEHIDPQYKKEFDNAIANGVKPLVYRTSIEISGKTARLELGKKIHF